VDELTRSSPSLQTKAQQGDLEAITQILEHITAAAQARVKAVRQNQTLRIYLTQAHRGSLDGCALMIYSAIYALGIDGLTKLVVLEGLPRQNHQQWQQTFTVATSTAAVALADHTNAASQSRRSLPPTPQSTAAGHSLEAATPHSTDLADPTVQVGHNPPPTRLQLWMLRPSRNKWLQWIAVFAFSFLVGAGMAQWRHGQVQPTVEATEQSRWNGG
jgi:hypothetical protein